MGMRSRKMKVGLAVLGVLLLSGVAGFLALALPPGGSQTDQGKGTNILSLARPALAEESTSFLDEEAGLSIYTNLGMTLSLSTAKAEFRTIERETDDHIVGSVALPGLSENHDVHCFVQKDGWVVVYYLKSEPGSKVIDWAHYAGGTLTSNNLRAGLLKICGAYGQTPSESKYYHFQYEHANEWMIVGESMSGAGSNSFNIMIPSDYTVYERSWSHYCQPSNNGSSRLYRNAVLVSNLFWVGGTSIGLFTVAELTPDVFHSFTVENNPNVTTGRAALVLIYRIP